VHDNGIHADEFQQRDVFSKIFLQRDIGHRIAAVLDDDVLVPEALDVRQGLNEHFGFLGSG
jgi:hypothetical protein